MEVIEDIQRVDIERTLWEIWLSKYPYMDKETYVSFEDYKNRCMKTPSKSLYMQSTNEILSEIEKIRRKAGEHYGDI